MKMQSKIPKMYLAPCGINCYCCYMHLRKKNTCLGCFDNSESKPESCKKCKKKKCVTEKGLDYCFQCEDYPCLTIKNFNKRYLDRYKVNLKDNLQFALENGIIRFMDREISKWKCTQCGGVINMHDKLCSECGRDYSI